MKFLSEETKLDFSDVLIVPIPSKLESRKNVNLTRKFKFKNNTWFSCVPIVAANMDTVGTISMGKELSNYDMLTAIHKHYPEEHLVKYFRDAWYKCKTFYTIGTSQEDLNKFKNVHRGVFGESKNDIFMICIDVANGYMEKLLDQVKYIRDNYPYSIICAGNVCTPEGTSNLIKAGADIVKVGIGGGCFVGGTLVKTQSGYKKIEKIQCGEEVLTHTGEYKPVSSKMDRLENDVILQINNIECTKNHEFYVIHTEHKDHVTKENIHQYAKWVSAENLSEEYFLVQITE